MMGPLLSILICSMPERKIKLDALLVSLRSQIAILDEPTYVEILCNHDIKISVGAKRNNLMASAKGQYLCFIDDDDRVTSDYISKIIKALGNKPEAVGMVVILTTDNVNPEIHTHFACQKDTYIPNPITGRIERGVCHLNPIKSSIAKSILFKDISNSEDTQWAQSINPLVASSENILEPIYHYDFQRATTLTQKPAAPPKVTVVKRMPAIRDIRRTWTA